MAEHRHLALEDQLRDLFHRSLLEQSVVGHEVGPPIPENPPKVACPEELKSSKLAIQVEKDVFMFPDYLKFILKYSKVLPVTFQCVVDRYKSKNIF